MAKEEKRQDTEKSKVDYHSQIEVQKALVENFILMQKVLSNLTVKFDDMSNQLNKFMQLMEISAKNFVDKTNKGEYRDNSDLTKKVDNLMQQNKMMMQNMPQNRPNPFPQQSFQQQSFDINSQFQPSLEPNAPPMFPQQTNMFQPPRPGNIPTPSNMQPNEEQQEY